GGAGTVAAGPISASGGSTTTIHDATQAGAPSACSTRYHTLLLLSLACAMMGRRWPPAAPPAMVYSVPGPDRRFAVPVTLTIATGPSAGGAVGVSSSEGSAGREVAVGCCSTARS